MYNTDPRGATGHQPRAPAAGATTRDFLLSTYPRGTMSNAVTAQHAKRPLWAGFFSIVAAGVGLAVRGRILADWAREYGVTQKELGDISGGGLWGFGLIIIAGSIVADRVGYGRLMGVAFLMHVL